MKRQKIKKLNISSDASLAEISAKLDALGDGTAINTVNWEEYNYQPLVRFNIAYNGQELFIKYYVTEDFVMAQKTQSNQSVCQDSCVEFFVSPVSDGPYYNFEFNPIGTCLLGKGTGRHDSTVVSTAVIDKIRRLSSLGNQAFEERQGPQTWWLTVAIPLEILFGNPVPELSGRIIRGNFYKCGDLLTQMHYLTWNPVDTPHPDYHRPEFFGVLEFE